jgi:pSer/pThr/pTyr-binding forkhead associated (FHA) protein
MASRRPKSLGEEVLQTTARRLTAQLNSSPRRSHRLEQTAGPGSPATFELSADSLVIGRGRAADLKVHSEDLSRTHARLIRIDDEYTLEDLDSRNGVFLNGLRVHAAVLRDGDQVQLGDIIFRYAEGA